MAFFNLESNPQLTQQEVLESYRRMVGVKHRTSPLKRITGIKLIRCMERIISKRVDDTGIAGRSSDLNVSCMSRRHTGEKPGRGRSKRSRGLALVGIDLSSPVPFDTYEVQDRQEEIRGGLEQLGIGCKVYIGVDPPSWELRIKFSQGPKPL